MCLGPTLSQPAASAVQGVTYVPVLAAFDPSLFQQLLCATPAPTPAPVPKAPAVRPGSFVQHTEVDDQLLGKTKLCKFFARGHCSRGKGCTFAHGRKELRSQPDLFKTEMCFEFSNSGVCHRGEACQYAHGQQELRVVAAPAPARRRAQPRAEAPKPQQSADLSKRIVEIQRESEQLREQIRSLTAETEKARSVGTDTGAPPSDCSWGRQTSQQSAGVVPQRSQHSWASDAGSDFDWDAAMQPAAVEQLAEEVQDLEPSFDTELVVAGTFLALRPLAAGARRRAESAPPRAA